MDQFLQDLRNSWRLIRRAPGVSIAVIGTLALAIGANTAIFAVVNATVLRPLPFRDPWRLVSVSSVRPERADAPFSLPEFLDYRRESRSLEALIAIANWSANLTGDGDAERLQGIRISADAFEVLGVATEHGRLLTRSDDEAQAARVAVISYGLWQRRFGGRADVIGRVLRLNAEPYVLVGVLPRHMPLPIRDVDVAVPLSPDRDPWREVRSSVNFLRFIARLRTGTTEQQAEAELSRICDQLRARFPVEYATKRAVRVADLQTTLVGDGRRTLLFLLCAVGVVLAVASANLANILLLRAVARQHEIAIRCATGATRGRLACQLLTETGVLAVLGGSAGLLLSSWWVKALIAAGPLDIPRLNETSIDMRAVAVTAGITVTLALVLGLVPVFQTRRLPIESLRSGRTSTGTPRQHGIRNALVALEMASALVLLVAGGLFVQSLIRLHAVDLGFRPRQVFVARVSLPRSAYTTPAQLSGFSDRLQRALERRPDVSRVGAVSLAPFSGLLATAEFTVVGAPAPSPGEVPEAHFRVVTPGYFETIGVRLVHGRFFTDRDQPNTPLAAIVSQSMVDRLLPGVHPIGRRLRIDDNSEAPREAEIVGVIANMRQVSLEQTAGQDLYIPLNQIHPGTVVWLANNQFWVVRTSGAPQAFERVFRDALKEADPDAAASHAGHFEDYVSRSRAPRQFNTLLLLLFAAAATALAGAGLYTVVSYSVRHRTEEIAVRLSLGATPAGIYRLVARQALAPVLVGWCAGAAATVVAARTLSGMLYEVGSIQPSVFLAATLFLLMIAVGAIIAPARRAAAVDTLAVLRTE